MKLPGAKSKPAKPAKQGKSSAEDVVSRKSKKSDKDSGDKAKKGLTLGRPVNSKLDKAAKSKDKVSPKMASKSKTLAKSKSKLSKSSRLREDEPITAGDEIITADSPDMDMRESVHTNSIEPVGPFEKGFVHRCFSTGVNAFWRKSVESDLLSVIIADELYTSALFVGDIAVKNSFIQGKGGQALL